MSERTPIVDKTDARQGETPHVARNVLAYGLLGVISLFVIAYIAFFA
jgi:hypothetical protein